MTGHRRKFFWALVFGVCASLSCKCERILSTAGATQLLATAGMPLSERHTFVSSRLPAVRVLWDWEGMLFQGHLPCQKRIGPLEWPSSATFVAVQRLPVGASRSFSESSR